MKKVMIAVFLLMAINVPAFADATPHDVIWNPIKIFNNTGEDISYTMKGSTFFNNIYAILRGSVDVYHSGAGDDYALFYVGRCTQTEVSSFPGEGVICKSHEEQHLCSDGHYNADQIQSIVINSLNSCTITCNDGSSTSCKLNG